MGMLHNSRALAADPRLRFAPTYPQMWLRPLWPYSREQDGVFVQLQALSVTAPSKPTKAAPGGGGAAAAKRERDTQDASADQSGPDGGGGSGGLARLWFVRLGEALEGGGFRTRTPHELPRDLALLPSLLR